MAKHTVCIKTVVNVIVEDVEADSHAEALKKAEDKVDFDALFCDNNANCGADRTGWGEEHTHAIVDKKPDDYDHFFKCKEDCTWESVDLVRRVNCWACNREAEGKPTTVKHVCGRKS